MQALESSEDVSLTGHLRTINGEWEALNKSKKSLLGFLNGHLTKYRAIEVLAMYTLIVSSWCSKYFALCDLIIKLA